MPCGPTMRRNQKKNPAASALRTCRRRGLRFLQVFFAARVPVRPACYLGIKTTDDAAPAPNASRGRKPAGTSSSEQ